MATIHSAISELTDQFVEESKELLKARKVFTLCSPFRLIHYLWAICYVLVQGIIIWAFKRPPPPNSGQLRNPYGRIAVIGAGITGVSSAAHIISHGFEVVIFEQSPPEKLGGIWAHVNTTSSLQLNSLIYRFHPAVVWQRGFPHRDEILSEVNKIWKEYHLDIRTRFNTKVTSVKRAPPPEDPSVWDHDPDRSRWIINDGDEGIFDAVVVTIGTCGDPTGFTLPGMPKRNQEPNTRESDEKQESDPPTKQRGEEETFAGVVVHSSQLDSPSFQLKNGAKVVVIGSGASGVEAVETLLTKFGSVAENNGNGVDVYMIARQDKWIIPRNVIIDIAISAQPFGREMPLSFLVENFLRRTHYKDLEQLAPTDTGIYEGTPIVNDDFLEHIRKRGCHYIRGAAVRLTRDGVVVASRSKRKKNSTGGKHQDVSRERGLQIHEVPKGEEKVYKADAVVLATGFNKPSLDFLPKELFPENYERPGLYLQNFSTEDWSILLTNSAYINAIGTVGHFHIGIYTRILLTFLLDQSVRPSPKDMKLWVDVLRFVKRGATGGALSFFTYMELTIWLVLFHIFRPDRIKWGLFVLFGWGVYPLEDELS